MFTFLSAFQRRRRRNLRHDGHCASDLEEKVAAMDPKVRAELTKDIIISATRENSQVIEFSKDDELDQCLEEARAMLKTAMERENLVSIRLRRYKDLLQRYALELTVTDNPDDLVPCVNEKCCQDKDKYSRNEENNNDSDGEEDDEVQDAHDEETGNHSNSIQLQQMSPDERQRRWNQMQRDVGALKKVEQDCESLKQYVRTLKLRVFKMERERDIILAKKNECKEFLLAVAMVEGKEDSMLQQHEEEEEVDDDAKIDENENEKDDVGEIELVEGGLAKNRINGDSIE
jgi:hypothetical protein